MKLRYPDYYKDFSCIADRCEDTCCAGWEIDIDDNSYEYYMEVPGAFGERIRNSIKEYQTDEGDVYECHGFLLADGKRCPFLNESNLCDIILELGEDALCDVCTYTPRNFLEYGNAREISISPSCAEAGRLIFSSREKVRFTEQEIPEELGFAEGEEELKIAAAVKEARDRAIAILQDRETDIYQRIYNFLYYAQEVQSCFNRNEAGQNLFLQMKGEAGEKALCSGKETSAHFTYFQKRMKSFQELDCINDEWGCFLERMELLFLEETGGQKRYGDTFKRFIAYMREKDLEYLWEQFMVYYAFLFLARCVDGLNFWGKAQFCVCSFLMVRDMALERFYQNGESFTVEDCVDIARIYAKEVEHSQENLEFLEEEFLFEEIYQFKALCAQII
ncbi:hypothetical protein D7V86_02735 [bacterium D16-51]|nr:hypothetical protein D7V96_02915 [bacterium D16-59]RKI62043.1 hypothetical protein D7V86_02735 [bacterium D16-51]